MASLTSRSMTAAMWGAAGSAVRVILQLATQILLARILGPAEFGIFAIGAIVISFSNFFADVGMAYGLIQKQKVSKEDVRFIFTWQFIIGAITTSIIIGSSDVIAQFFGNERAHDIVSALSILCFIHALTAPSTNILKRNLDYKPLQIGQIVGYVVGYILVGLPLALLGYGVWSLVIAWIILATTNLAFVYDKVRHEVKPLFWFEGCHGLMRYGVAVFFTNILNWIILNIDRTLVGRHFPAIEMGLYSTAYNILYNPTGTLVGAVQPVFFSASATVSEDVNRIRSAYETLISTTLLLFLPCFVFMAAISDTIILALYGKQWAAAAGAFRPFALAMPLYIFTALTTPIIWTSGRGLREFTSQIPLVIIWVSACWLAVGYSMTTMAWTVLGLYALRSIVIGREAMRATGITLLRIFMAIRGAVLLSAAVAAAALFCDTSARQISSNVSVWITLDILIFSLVFVAMIRYVPITVSPGSIMLLNQLNARLPSRYAQIIPRLFHRKGS